MHSSNKSLTSSIAVIGAGDVGASIAYSLLLNPVAHDVVLVDLKEELLEAQVRDLGDATYRGNAGVRVKKGTFEEAGQADVIVITAGAKQKKGEDRLSLLSRNLSILQSIFSSMKPLNQDAVILVVSNPVDILTHFARQLSGLPPTQVIGSGTSLDSARLRGRLAQELEVSPNSVNAYVLGEHGESQFIYWSGVSVGCTPFKLLHHSDNEFRNSVEKYTAGAAAAIIEAKGCTNFGIGNIAASLCKYILSDQRTIRPVSFYQEDLGVTLSMPAVIGRKGIVRTMKVELNEDEQKKLDKSAKALKEMQDKAQSELDKAQEEVKKDEK